MGFRLLRGFTSRILISSADIEGGTALWPELSCIGECATSKANSWKRYCNRTLLQRETQKLQTRLVYLIPRHFLQFATLKRGHIPKQGEHRQAVSERDFLQHQCMQGRYQPNHLNKNEDAGGMHSSRTQNYIQEQGEAVPLPTTITAINHKLNHQVWSQRVQWNFKNKTRDDGAQSPRKIHIPRGMLDLGFAGGVEEET